MNAYLIPLLSEHGKIVNVGSHFGQLKYQTEAVRNVLGDPSVTLEKINDALSSLEQMAMLDD